MDTTTSARADRPAPPPGPSGLPLLGSLLDLRRDPLGFFADSARRYGDVVRLRLGGASAYLISDPAAIEGILVGTGRRFVKGYDKDPVLPLFLGNGLVTSEGDFWLRQRRLMQPAFHRQRVAGFGAAMVAATEEAAAGWRDGERRDLHTDLMRLTLDILMRTVFSAPLGADAGRVERSLNVVLDEYMRQSLALLPLPAWAPSPGRSRMLRAIRELHVVVDRLIDSRLAGGAGPDDLLTMLLEARDEAGQPMPRRQLRDELLTLILAGHETTANALAWTLALLARHPEAEARLHAEVDALGDRPAAAADLPALRYADAVVKESMRLFPPVWMISRAAAQPATVGGYDVPAGRDLYLSAWVVHRDPRLYAEPAAFRPERWLDGLEQHLPRYAFMPFGGGPRLCIGNSFAQMEATLILATLARRFRLSLAPGQAVTPEPTMTLRPRGGLPMTVARRPGR